MPYQQWELCIELVHASDGVDTAYIQQLWDLYLKQVSWLSAMLAETNAVLQKIRLLVYKIVYNRDPSALYNEAY